MSLPADRVARASTHSTSGRRGGGVGLRRGRDGAVVPSAFRRAAPRVHDADPVLSWVGAAAITLLAAFLRLWDLGRPRAFLFDEVYYARDAWSLLHFGYARGYAENASQQILAGHVAGQWTDAPSMVVHPETGKWIIALGEWAFGMTPFGWRVSAAVVGSLMVLVMVRLARRVTGSTMLGLVAGLLMCFDGLQLVLSRLALLDIFQAFFMLCAVSCTVADRDWGRGRLADRVRPTARLDPRSWGPRLLWRPWRLAAGLCWGLSVSTKWSTLYVLVAFGLLMWVWDAGARRSFGVRWALLKSAVLDALPALGYVVLLPLVVYLLSWTGWLLHAHAYETTLSHTQYGPYWGAYTQHEAHGFFPSLGQGLRSLWHYHHDVYAFHTKFLDHSHHTYQSSPWGWLTLNRPVGVDAQLNIKPGHQGCAAAAGTTCLRQVLLLGNPAVWWIGTVASVVAAISWVVRRDWRYGMITVGIAAAWLPWLRYDERPIFSYYAIMIEPFVILALTMMIGELLGRAPATELRRRTGAIAAGGILLAVLVCFAWFWPVWTDGLLTDAEWTSRIWFKSWI